LCGWERDADVPSEATHVFAYTELVRRLHEALCREQLADKLKIMRRSPLLR
jgi:hypothetical protein